jgi:hypothetical protein
MIGSRKYSPTVADQAGRSASCTSSEERCDLNEGFDRFNPLNEALAVPACLGFAKCNNAHRNALPPHRAP